MNLETFRDEHLGTDADYLVVGFRVFTELQPARVYACRLVMAN